LTDDEAKVNEKVKTEACKEELKKATPPTKWIGEMPTRNAPVRTTPRPSWPIPPPPPTSPFDGFHWGSPPPQPMLMAANGYWATPAHLAGVGTPPPPPPPRELPWPLGLAPRHDQGQAAARIARRATVSEDYSTDAEDTEEVKPKHVKSASQVTKPRRKATTQLKVKEDKKDQVKKKTAAKKGEGKEEKAPGAKEAPSLKSGGLILMTPGVTDAIQASSCFHEQRAKELKKAIG
jgi:hypothetical protein